MAPIQFGVLEISYQLLDVGLPVDFLSSCSKDYIRGMEVIGAAPPGLSDKGIDIDFHYIGLTMEPQVHTAQYACVPTTTVDNCPKLDYLLIGGPDPATFANMDPRWLKFIRERVPEVKTLFTTCTGGMVAALAGVLDGVSATTNHGAIPMAKQMMPKVDWVADKQWVVGEGGKFWTAGGAFAGADMFAAWIAEKYGQEVVMVSNVALDFVPRDVLGKHIVRAQ